MVDIIQRTGIVIEVSYYDENIQNLFFDVENCEVEGDFLAIEHYTSNRNDEGKTIRIATYIDLKRVKGYKLFESLDDYNGYYGVLPKPTFGGEIIPDWGSGKKYRIEIEYLDKDNKPNKVFLANVVNASYIREVGLDMLRFEYILPDGHKSYYGIGLAKLVKWKVVHVME